MMKWRFPRTLIIKFAADVEGTIAANLIVYLVINMKVKNDFWLGPFVTDSAGMITLAGNALDRDVEETIDLGLMDYLPPTGRSATVSIVVPSRGELEEMVRRLVPVHAENASRLASLVRNCTNDDHERVFPRIVESGLKRRLFRISSGP